MICFVCGLFGAIVFALLAVITNPGSKEEQCEEITYLSNVQSEAITQQQIADECHRHKVRITFAWLCLALSIVGVYLFLSQIFG